MRDPVFLDDFGLETKDIRIRGVDGDTNPMAVGRAKGFHAREVVDDPPAFRSK